MPLRTADGEESAHVPRGRRERQPSTWLGAQTQFFPTRGAVSFKRLDDTRVALQCLLDATRYSSGGDDDGACMIFLFLREAMPNGQDVHRW